MKLSINGQYTIDTVNTVNTIDTVNTVNTIDTVNTVNTSFTSAFLGRLSSTFCPHADRDF